MAYLSTTTTIGTRQQPDIAAKPNTKSGLPQGLAPTQSLLTATASGLSAQSLAILTARDPQLGSVYLAAAGCQVSASMPASRSRPPAGLWGQLRHAEQQ